VISSDFEDAKSDDFRTMARYSWRMQRILTPRELEVALLVACGKSNRAIAQHLSVSRRTIENHLHSIFSKLNVYSRTQLAFEVYKSSDLKIAV
jgi:DNA-binding NarL/FixJ family response regulator